MSSPTFLSNPDDSSNGVSPANQAPAYGDPGQPSAPPASQPAAPAPSGGTFGRILKGALQGLALGGVPSAIGGAIDPDQPARVIAHRRALAQAEEQQAQANVQATQSSIKFQSAQAANAVAEAAKNNAVAATIPAQARDAHMASQLQMADTLQQMGITPTVIADDTHEAARSALEGLTSTQGGVPHLFNLEVGGQHLAYNLDQLSQTPQGLSVINQARAAQGQDPLTAAQWRQTPKAAQSQVAENALKFWAPAPTTNAAQANGLYLQYKAFADAYGKSPNADPAVKDRLDKLVGNLQSQKNGQVDQEKSLKGSNAYAAAAGQAQAKNDVAAQNYQTIAQNDVTGWKPKPGVGMSDEQYNTVNARFVAGPLAKAQDTEKSYQMFQDAYANRNDAKSGASSMLALSQHLATTFGSVKGSRVTKDMIQHHLGARSVSDSAQVAVQKLTNGDVLSPSQWNDFNSLISDARSQTWKNTVSLAHSMGLPVTADMLPAQKGK